MRAFNLIKVVVIALCITQAANAEQAERFGPYIAHYNTFNTNSLTPAVAKAYGITRSSNLALINVAVLRARPEALDEAVTANVSVRATNLVGQKKTIELIEIQDQGAIYYIGTFGIRNEERINFEVRIQPTDGSAIAHTFRFHQTFYVSP
jgi:hypothetical protein